METLSFILGVGAVAAIVVIVVTFMNNKQIKELNKQIENLKSTDNNIYNNIDNLEIRILDVIKEVDFNQRRENEEIVRFVDSRVDKLEDKIYKNFDIKQNQSNIY
jgi:predicted PurR-regulated permease PerM